MKSIILKLLSIILLCAMLFSCVDEGFEQTTTDISPEPQQLIATSIHGKVLDKSGQVISNALVTLKSVANEQTFTTDEHGNFEFIRYNNKGVSAYLQVEANGYFDGYRRVSLVKDNFNYTRIRLLQKEIVGSFNTSAGGTVSTSEGMQVQFDANSIVRANGSAYNGQVRVAMAWVDPSGEDLPDLMIGDLSGRTIEGNEVSLASYGMVYVELYDNANNDLQIKEGNTASLTYPVPASRMTTAPSTIPLWSYDRIVGTWQEESFATLSGNQYIGEVSHFSEWNVDFMADPISINGCLNTTDQDRNINIRAQIFVCSDLIGTKGGWVCPDGKFLFYNFPKDEVFTLKVKNECGNVIYEQEYGPYGEDTDLGNIDISLPDDISVATVTGTAIFCDGSAVTNGYVKIEDVDGNVRFSDLVDDGSFEFDILLCNNNSLDATLAIFEFDSLKQNDPITLTITEGIQNIGVVELCDDIMEYITVVIDGQLDETHIEPLFSNTLPAGTEIYVDFPNDSVESGLYIGQFVSNADDIGTYNAQAINYHSIPRDNYFYLAQGETCEVIFTTFGSNPGDVITGTYSAVVDGAIGPTSILAQQVTGEFRIIVD